MEKGNALGASLGAGVGDSAAGAGLMESTTTVTSVVSGVGATAADSLTKAVADKASEAAIDEARQRLGRQHAAGDGDDATGPIDPDDSARA